MGQGGIQRVDHEAAGKAPRFTPAEGGLKSVAGGCATAHTAVRVKARDVA